MVLAYGPYHVPEEEDWHDYEPEPELDEGEVGGSLVGEEGPKIGLCREQWGHAVEDHEAAEEPGYEEYPAPESRLSLAHSSSSDSSDSPCLRKTEPSPVNPRASRKMAKG